MSLRLKKKNRTWEAIAREGLALFLKNGFAETTLEQIAEAADVHKQTVLRYFATKEEIAFASYIRTQREFEEGLNNPSRSESVIDYWRAHVSRAATSVTQSGSSLRAFKLTQRDPKLLAYFLTIDRRYESLLAEAFSQEAGADPETDRYALLLAAMLVGGNAAVARKILLRKDFERLHEECVQVVDFAINHFPARSAVTSKPARTGAAKPASRSEPALA